MSKIEVINVNGSEEFEKEVLKSKLPVLVDFWAPWCMPCRMMAPILDELAEKMDGKIVVAKVDTEKVENHDLARKYEIQSIPNMKLFKDGEVIGDFVGLRDLETIKNDIEAKI